MSEIIPGAKFDRAVDSLSSEELLAPPLPDNNEEVVSDMLGACDEYAARFKTLLSSHASTPKV